MVEWFEACGLDELPEGSLRQVEVGGESVCLAHHNGRVYAVADMCTHAAASLAEGEIEGDAVECWLHGARFNLATGEVESPPATVPLQTFESKVEGEGEHARIFVGV